MFHDVLMKYITRKLQKSIEALFHHQFWENLVALVARVKYDQNSREVYIKVLY